jgi:tetratricopeptide (TPR) repeat protein
VANKTTQTPKRQLVADAILAATEGRWSDALSLNDQMLERFPRDSEALNRKGRALIELRQLESARSAYHDALKSDPANMIARRNLQRLEMLYNRTEGSAEGSARESSPLPRANVFVEEIGKTWVDELANPADLTRLAEVSPGDQLVIEAVDGKVYIRSVDGLALGEVGSPVSERMAQLIAGGNRYEAFALGISSHSLRIIIREIYKHPAQATEISFKEQARKTQDLMRERELLSLRDEGDFIFGDDEDESDEDTSDNDDDMEDEEPDPDAAAYVDDAVTSGDDEEPDAM